MPRPDRSRHHLVSATAQLLRRQGYAGTATSDILRASGATKGSLYHHFPGGKENIAVAALRSSAAAVETALRDALSSRPIGEALHAWIDRLADEAARDARDGCPIAPTALESSHVSEQLRVEAAAAFERWVGVLRQALIQEGQAPHQAATTSLLILAAVEGALLLSRTSRDTRALHAVLAGLPRLLPSSEDTPDLSRPPPT